MVKQNFGAFVPAFGLTKMDKNSITELVMSSRTILALITRPVHFALFLSATTSTGIFPFDLLSETQTQPVPFIYFKHKALEFFENAWEFKK